MFINSFCVGVDKNVHFDLCECVFSGKTRGAWTRCEFLTESLDVDIDKIIFILLNFNLFTVVIPTV